MTKPIFKTEREKEAWESLMHNIFKKVWNNIAKPDIDRYLAKKTEQMDENTQRINRVYDWLAVVKIKDIYIPVGMLMIGIIAISALVIASLN